MDEITARVNSEDSSFTNPMICCVITATIRNSKRSLHLAKPATFARVCSVDFSNVDKIVSRQQDTEGAEPRSPAGIRNPRQAMK